MKIIPKTKFQFKKVNIRIIIRNQNKNTNNYRIPKKNDNLPNYYNLYY